MKRSIKTLIAFTFAILMILTLSVVSLADEARSYTVTWKIGDEVVRENYKVGEIPTFKSNVSDSSDEYDYFENKSGDIYQIVGWDSEISEVSGNVSYTAITEKCYFSFTKSEESGVEYYTTRDIIGAFSRVEGVGHIKLYDDISLSTTPTERLKVPTVPAGKTLYFDLNGHYYSMSGFGSVNGNKLGNLATAKGAKLYVYSSREGGELYNSYKWWSSSSVNGIGVFSIGSDSEIHVGKVTYDGVTYDGDNLSVYMGILCYNYGSGALYIDGGTYNATYADAGGIIVLEKETVIDARNATFNAKNGSFFRMKEDDTLTSADDPINANFVNCVFKNDSTKSTAFVSAEYDEYQFKLGFVGCEFAIAPSASYGRWTYFGEGCAFLEGANINGSKVDPALAQWKSGVTKTYTYKENTFAFDDKTENGVRTSYIKLSSFVETTKTREVTFGIYLAKNELDTKAAVTVSDGFEYRFYLPKSAYMAGGVLTVNGEVIDYSAETEIIDGQLYYVVKLTADDPIGSVKTANAILTRTRFNDKQYVSEWSLSVVGYMDELLSEEEYSEIHTLAIDYLAYIEALCEYKGLVSQNVKMVLNKYADKITPSAPANLGEATLDTSSISGFFYLTKLELSNSPKLVLLIKPNAVGSARIVYTDNDGVEQSILLERSLITATETVNGVVYKRYDILLGALGINFDITIKTYSSGKETGSINYNLATYVAGVRSSNSSQYSYIFLNLIDRLSAYSVSAKAYMERENVK